MTKEELKKAGELIKKKKKDGIYDIVNIRDSLKYAGINLSIPEVIELLNKF